MSSSVIPQSTQSIDFAAMIKRIRKTPDGVKRIEQLVIRLLARLVADENGSLEVNEGTGFDAISLTGIDDLPGPTIIDVTHRLRRVQQSPNYWPDLQKYVAFRAAKSVLLIATGVSDRLPWVTQEASVRLPGVILRIWGPENLSILMDKYPDAVGDLVPELGTQAIAAVIRAAEEDWLQKRNRQVAELRAAYFADRMTIFVGAGASAGCGVPDWKRLISELAVSMVHEESNKQQVQAAKKMTDIEMRTIAEAMVRSQLASPLLVARYLENGLPGQFTRTLSRVLYSDIKPASESKLVTAIAGLCRPTRTRKGVRAVVSYNFDDLLEEALDSAKVRRRSIFREGDIPDADELPVYHVHGMLERQVISTSASDFLLNEDAPDRGTLVFSEDSYFSLQSDHYSWANFEQLKLLRETTCLLIGLSGNDPNLRRLLSVDARQSKKVKHFICLRRQTVEDLLGGESQVRSEAVQHFLDVHHTLQEASFRSLGLNVLWLEQYGSLPSLLDQLSSHVDSRQ